MANDMLDVEYVQKQMEMSKRKEILDSHIYDIWQGENGYWYTYIPHDKGNAKRKQIKKKSEKEIEDAIVAYYKVHREKHTFSAMVKEWMNYKLEKEEIRKQTYDRYLTDYKRFLENTDIVKKDVNNITDWELEDFIKDTIRDMELTNKAYGGLRTLIKGTFKYCFRRKITQLNIEEFFDNIDISQKMFKKNVKNSQELVFTDEEVDMVINWVFNGHDESITNLAILIGFFTGMRIGEIVALKREDVDLVKGTIFVHRTEEKYRHPVTNEFVYDVRDSTKTDAGIRTIVMNTQAIQVMQRIFELNQDNEFLIISENGRVKEQNVSKKLTEICGKLGILKRTMNKTRKTFCTKMVNSGADESLIIEQMGHTNITTSKNYYYYNNLELSKVREVVDNAICYAPKPL